MVHPTVRVACSDGRTILGEHFGAYFPDELASARAGPDLARRAFRLGETVLRADRSTYSQVLLSTDDREHDGGVQAVADELQRGPPADDRAEVPPGRAAELYGADAAGSGGEVDQTKQRERDAPPQPPSGADSADEDFARQPALAPAIGTDAWIGVT